MKRITKVVLSVAALAVLAFGASFAHLKSCCPDGPCCNGACCKMAHHVK
ncbi:MAG TPA: hypothetical protein VMB03_06080 [Bryobacteraceae bacterium]|nr:hypothetical protein [Bryobacteraceae bacterium]